MPSLQDLLGQEQGDAAINQISQEVGVEPTAVSSAIQTALPALLNGLADNVSTPDGAQNLNNALDQDHDGSVLNNLGNLAGMIFGGGQAAAPPREADAGSILGHILGGSQTQVAQQASNRSGLEIGQVAHIMMMLAPIVMGYLGQQKQQQGIGADGLGGLIGGLLDGQSQQASVGGVIGEVATSVLDTDHDGSVVDDIATLAFKYIAGK
jgi:hypothetical protein